MKKILYAVFCGILITGYAVYGAVYVTKGQVEKSNSNVSSENKMDTIVFGSYHQPDVSSNTKDPIEWLVLEKKGNNALLISKNILDRKQFNNISKEIEWKDSSLRLWLNNNFYNDAFNSDEKSYIISTSITNDAFNVNGSAKKSSTNDKIFLLSSDEESKYLNHNSRANENNSNQADIKKAMEDLKNGSLKLYEGEDDYWTRTTLLNGIGAWTSGPSVDYSLHDVTDVFGVRPAMWVSLDSSLMAQSSNTTNDVNVDVPIVKNGDNVKVYMALIVENGNYIDEGVLDLVISGINMFDPYIIGHHLGDYYVVNGININNELLYEFRNKTVDLACYVLSINGINANTEVQMDNAEIISGMPKINSNLRSDNHFYIVDYMQKNIWVLYNTYYYHVDANGNIEKSKWIEQRYVGIDGRMYRGRKTPDGKWVGDDGLVVDITNDLSNSINIKANEPNSWYKTQSGLWYYFENDRTTTKKGWFTDSRDNQTYYLDPHTGIMAVGWTKINGSEYYFNESHDNENNWYEIGGGFYESYGKKTKAYGSMFKNETTPDGKKVDANGRLVK